MGNDHQASSGIRLSGIVVLAFAGLGVAYLQLGDRFAFDEKTLCPEAGPNGIMVAVLDLSDPLSTLQAGRLRTELSRQITEAPEGTMISVAIVDPDSSISGIRFGLCRPQAGWEASMLYQNKAMIEERFREEFEAPLEQAIKSMLRGEEQATSPIIETIHQAVVDTFGYRTDDISKKLVLVSDLYQNSSMHSFYRGHDWDDFRSSPSYATKSEYLDGFDVVVMRVPRPVPRSSTNDAVEDFWVNYLEASGVKSIDVDNATLGGI